MPTRNDNRLRIILHINVHIENTLRAFRVASVPVMVMKRKAPAPSLPVTAAFDNDPSRVISRNDITLRSRLGFPPFVEWDRLHVVW